MAKQYRPYCDGYNFLDVNGGHNPEVKPHLHCNGFVSYKRSNNDHINITEDERQLINRANKACEDANSRPAASRAIQEALLRLCWNEKGMPCESCQVE